MEDWTDASTSLVDVNIKYRKRFINECDFFFITVLLVGIVKYTLLKDLGFSDYPNSMFALLAWKVFPLIVFGYAIVILVMVFSLKLKYNKTFLVENIESLNIRRKLIIATVIVNSGKHFAVLQLISFLVISFTY